MRGKKNGVEDREFIREIKLTNPILSAFTVALRDKVIEKRTLFVTDEKLAEEFAGLVIEQYAQASILELSKFKQFHGDKPACICSQWTRDKVEPKESTNAILVPRPFRSSKYPRDFYESDWIEPFVTEKKDDGEVVTPNPKWESATWEMMIYIDPAQAFYDTMPINLYRVPDGFVFEVSGDFLLLDDAVDCVPVKLHEEP